MDVTNSEALIATEFFKCKGLATASPFFLVGS